MRVPEPALACRECCGALGRCKQVGSHLLKSQPETTDKQPEELGLAQTVTTQDVGATGRTVSHPAWK